MSVLAQALIAGYGSAGSGADPFYSNVVLLLSMNGTNGSTTFTDRSPTPKTFAANGNAQISTAQSRFGGASGLFDGAGDWITTPGGGAYNLGTQNFTLEFFIRPISLSSSFYVTGQADALLNNVSTSVGIFVLNTGVIGMDVGQGSSLLRVQSAMALAINTWYHIAFCRSGGSLLCFVDGVLQNTTAISGVINSSTADFSIGRIGFFNGFYTNGYIDEYRYTVGVARYTSNFTPPAAPFPDF